MHIRTIGELHDVINEQAAEIAKLKADLLASKASHKVTNDNYRNYRVTNKLTLPKTRTEKLRVFVANNLLGENTNKKTIHELAEKFCLAPVTVQNVWSETNRKGAAL